MKIVPQSAELIWITPNPIQQIELAGRTAYKSEDKISPESAVKFLSIIQTRKHKSVLEHACASIRVICDRGVSHEIVRHRLFSFTQESTRYCNYGTGKFGNEITVIEPPGLVYNGSNCSGDIWKRAMIWAEGEYLNLLRDHVYPQIARSVLPNALKTEIVITGNFRQWEHFLSMRTAKDAHPQMQEVANMVKVVLNAACPEVFLAD